MNKGEKPAWSESEFAKELAAAIVNKFKERNKNKPERKKTNITEIATPTW
jgi:hypothetical protein